MRIGGVNIETPLALAPMAGVTDLAFRTICRELGAGYTVTEMASAKARLELPAKILISFPWAIMCYILSSSFCSVSFLISFSPEGTKHKIQDFSRRLAAQPFFTVCRARAMARASAGTSSVTVLPAAV